MSYSYVIVIFWKILKHIFKKYLKVYLPAGCELEHDGSGDAHGEILICGELFK